MTEGSSPLSRGILGGQAASHRGAGIIPALAGNTFALTSVMMVAPDHPRSRGEYQPDRPLTMPFDGSSPLSRGIRLLGRVHGFISRIIPALAGNTPQLHRSPTVPSDHPRSRGEYEMAPVNDPIPNGSSPLSRGIHSPEYSPTRILRIIPALAGNTGVAGDLHDPRTDHPRSRGEYTLMV